MFSSQAEIETIAQGLLDKSLPKAEWTHAAHFAAGVWLLAAPDYEAYRDMPDIIRRYNEATGVVNSDKEGYHETITIASLKVCEYFLRRSNIPSELYQTINELLKSPYGQSKWVFEHWSQSCLFSVKARQEWVPPDIKALNL